MGSGQDMQECIQAMAAAAPCHTAWLPWPSRTTAVDRAAMLHLAASQTHLVALLGSHDAGPLGRFGLVGIPAATQTLVPGTDVISNTYDHRPRDMIRVAALGYELGTPEVYLPFKQPPRGQPAGWVADLHTALIVDHSNHTYAIVSLHATDEARHQRTLLHESVQWSGTPTGERALVKTISPGYHLKALVSDAEHMRRIRLVQQAIADGDIYQANLTRRLLITPTDQMQSTGQQRMPDGAALLAALAQRNPVAHNAYLRFPGHEIISNSMETLLTYAPDTRLLHTYPIKGTCARTGDAALDARAQQALCTHPKERAEHVMIVDLLRNDLGKIAVPGSVSVPRLMGIDGFHGVFHGVSTVQATLDSHHTPGQALAALFPGGSITGAPKRRAMEIISQLEQEPRGFYTGSIAVMFPNGTLSASILIRTIVGDKDGMSLSVGGGIVVDSIPQREVDETWEKVAVFREILRA